jgi:hypothetical protein
MAPSQARGYLRGMSKWQSEAIWRDALTLMAERISDAERPDFILYHHGVLDAGHKAKHRSKLRQSYERILAAGLPEWRERHDA